MANLIGTWTRFKRESQRFLRVYLQTLLAPVVSNLLYLAIFGLSLNKAIPNIEGISYLQFITPGLIMMEIINNALQNPSSSLMISKYQGHIIDLLIIPLQKFEILFAYIASAIFRAFLVGFITYLTLIFFVDFLYTSIILIFITAFLVSLFFSFLGFFIGIWAKEFDQLSLVQNFILMPMIFLGGVFYKISNLPPFFQKISSLNPIVYMIDLFRYSLTGVHDFNIYFSLSIISIASIFMGFVCYYILKTGWKIQN